VEKESCTPKEKDTQIGLKWRGAHENRTRARSWGAQLVTAEF